MVMALLPPALWSSRIHLGAGVDLWTDAGRLQEEHGLFVQLAFTEPHFFCRGRGKVEGNEHV
jgi:hypothetical protein